MCWQLVGRIRIFRPDPARKLSAHIPLLCVQWKTPDDGQRNCPKHVEFYSKNKFEKLVRLVGHVIRTDLSYLWLRVEKYILTPGGGDQCRRVDSLHAWHTEFWGREKQCRITESATFLNVQNCCILPKSILFVAQILTIICDYFPKGY